MVFPAHAVSIDAQQIIRESQKMELVENYRDTILVAEKLLSKLKL